MRLKLTTIILTLMIGLTPLFAQQKGKASYYSRKMTGARTASGARLDNDSLVCAHRTHPFGTFLLVKNPRNGKEVIVRVIDRGPHTKGRIIDLSYEAARRLDMLTQGVATVEVSIYNPHSGIPYAPSPESLPELDLETTQPNDTIDVVPIWQRNKSKAKPYEK